MREKILTESQKIKTTITSILENEDFMKQAVAKHQATIDTYLKLCGQVMVIENILNERQLKDPVTTVIQDEILMAELNNFT